MNRLLPKVFIFITFFGSCIIIGLLLSALVTRKWIVSDVSPSGNVTSRTQYGTIEFGLFDYQKSLNHGYGIRHENFSVLEIIKTDEDFMSYHLWLFTALGTGISLFASAVAAVASVIGTIKQDGGMALMFTSNVVSGIGQIVAFICWALQFFHYLQHNVLMKDETKKWTSAGQSTFGISFYFIIFAFIVVMINLTLLFSATRIEKRHRKQLEPIEEKEGNSIMLY